MFTIYHMVTSRDSMETSEIWTDAPTEKSVDTVWFGHFAAYI